MSVRIGPYRRDEWEADICVLPPEGREHPEHPHVSITSKTAVTRWAEKRKLELLVNAVPNDHRDAAPDLRRVSKQLARVFDAMGDDARRTLEKIAESAGERHASISTLQTDRDKSEGCL